VTWEPEQHRQVGIWQHSKGSEINVGRFFLCKLPRFGRMRCWQPKVGLFRSEIRRIRIGHQSTAWEGGGLCAAWERLVHCYCSRRVNNRSEPTTHAHAGAKHVVY
jgi:hypothetical protein